MNQPMITNANVYKLTATSSSGAITLSAEDVNIKPRSVIVYNSGSEAVFVTSGGTSPTAVFPTSATVPVKGQVVAPGAMATYSLPDGHKFIAAITASGSVDIYVSVGGGI